MSKEKAIKVMCPNHVGFVAITLRNCGGQYENDWEGKCPKCKHLLRLTDITEDGEEYR